MTVRRPRAAVARIWEGRTRASMAKEYAAYLHEQGVKKLRATKGNLGVEVFCRKRGGVADFMTISYWNSREEIRAYAGNDIEKTHHLPKDRDYLLELPRYVKHFDVLLSD